MQDINLLPWRQQVREKQHKLQIYFTLLLIAIGILITIALHLSYRRHWQGQQASNRILSAETRKLTQDNSQLKKLKSELTTLNQRIALLHQLQKQRHHTTQLFQTLTKVVPKDVYFKRMSRKGALVSLSGQAPSSLLISQLIKDLDASAHFSNPRLKEVTVQTVHGNRITHFKLSFEENLNNAS